MLAKKIKAKIRKNRKLTIHVPDLPPGEVEIIILSKEEETPATNRLELLPRHRVGQIYSNLNRYDIYDDAR